MCERASFLSVLCLVSRSQPMTLHLPDCVHFMIEPGASRAPSPPARTREKQHRPCTQLGRKGNFNSCFLLFICYFMGKTITIKIKRGDNKTVCFIINYFSSFFINVYMVFFILDDNLKVLVLTHTFHCSFPIFIRAS